jgi:hypothetical protein
MTTLLEDNDADPGVTEGDFRKLALSALYAALAVEESRGDCGNLILCCVRFLRQEIIAFADGALGTQGMTSDEQELLARGQNMFVVVVIASGDGEESGHRVSSIRCASEKAAKEITAWLLSREDKIYDGTDDPHSYHPFHEVKVFRDDPTGGVDTNQN